jgi:hypothetical protein
VTALGTFEFNGASYMTSGDQSGSIKVFDTAQFNLKFEGQVQNDPLKPPQPSPITSLITI